MKSDVLKVKSVWSDTITFSEINDFISIQEEVFSVKFSQELFKRKYQKNIFGNSLLVLAYDEKKCVAARAFWKNEINSEIAYQPCDTAVTSEYRGKGLFKIMTQEGLKNLPDNVQIFNFPNDKSYEAYKKIGWQLHSIKKFKIFNYFNNRNDIDLIPQNYLNWLLENNTDLVYVNLNKEIFLIKKRKYNLYYIVGKITKTQIEETKLRRKYFPLLCFYSSKGRLGRGLYTVTMNINENIEIPVYKLDTLFSD